MNTQSPLKEILKIGLESTGVSCVKVLSPHQPQPPLCADSFSHICASVYVSIVFFHFLSYFYVFLFFPFSLLPVEAFRSEAHLADSCLVRCQLRLSVCCWASCRSPLSHVFQTLQSLMEQTVFYFYSRIMLVNRVEKSTKAKLEVGLDNSCGVAVVQYFFVHVSILACNRKHMM